MKRAFEKYLILKYIVGSYVKLLLFSAGVIIALLAVLLLSGVYPRIESALDLKYNSPFVLVPLYGFIAMAVISFFVGFLLYFYRYKRPKSKSAFCTAFSKMLNEKQTDKN